MSLARWQSFDDGRQKIFSEFAEGFCNRFSHCGTDEVFETGVWNSPASGFHRVVLMPPKFQTPCSIGQFGDQRPFFSMKLVKGETLAGLLSARKTPAEDRAKFLGIAEMARLEAVNERDRAEKSQQAEFLQREKAEAAETSEAAQRMVAEDQRDKATALSDALALEKQELDRQKEEQRRMLYTSDMNLVQSAWEADNVNRVIELLNAHRPQPGQVDLRGFEWHYWNRQSHSNLRTVKLKKGSTYTPAVFSPDGKRLVGTR